MLFVIAILLALILFVMVPDLVALLLKVSLAFLGVIAAGAVALLLGSVIESGWLVTAALLVVIVATWAAIKWVPCVWRMRALRWSAGSALLLIGVLCAGGGAWVCFDEGVAGVVGGAWVLLLIGVGFCVGGVATLRDSASDDPYVIA